MVEKKWTDLMVEKNHTKLVHILGPLVSGPIIFQTHFVANQKMDPWFQNVDPWFLLGK